MSLQHTAPVQRAVGPGNRVSVKNVVHQRANLALRLRYGHTIAMASPHGAPLATGAAPKSEFASIQCPGMLR